MNGNAPQGQPTPNGKLKRRISLQANTRLSAMTIPDKVITVIVKHQLMLFRNKSKGLEKAYAMETPKYREAKILDDWIFIASSYCTMLTDIDFQYIDEMLIQVFAAFYTVLKFKLADESLMATLQYTALSKTDRHNIDVLFKQLQLALNSKHTDYLTTVVDIVNSGYTLPLIKEKEISIHQDDGGLAGTGRESLDPKLSNFRNSTQSPADFYPADNISQSSSSSSSASSMTSISHLVKNGILTIPTIDLAAFEALNTSTLLVMNIRRVRLSSKHRHILTVEPTRVDDQAYFQSDILPFIQHKDVIVLFSDSTQISQLENSIYRQLLQNNFSRVYWLEGGFATFQKYFISSHNIKKVSSTNAKSLIPGLPTGVPEVPQIRTESSDNLYNTSREIPEPKPRTTLDNSPSPSSPPPPPPIPNAMPVLSLTDGSGSNSPNGPYNPYQLHTLTYSGLGDTRSSHSNNKSPSSMMKSSSNRTSIYGLPNGMSTLSLQNGQSQPHSRTSPIPVPVHLNTIPVTDSNTHPIYQLSRLDYKPTINLRNLGSTCYINSMVQCLFSVNKFREFFIDKNLRQPYIVHSKTPETAPLTFGFYDLFQTFYDKSPHNLPPPTIDPRRFLSIIATLNPSYNIPNEQQDTSQFLYYIIDELHKELKMPIQKSEDLGFVKPQPHLPDEFNAWQIQNFQHEGFSYIQNIFNIKEAVVMRCSRCGYVSTRYDTSVMIHLSLKEKKSSLADIIANNFLPEEMSSRFGNAWDCDGCNEAEKRLEELQEKLERLHDLNVAQSKRETQDVTIKDKDDKKSKRKRFRFHISNKSSKDGSDDHKKTEILNDFVPPPPTYANILTDKEKSEYNQLADIFTRERIAFRSVELIDLPEVLVICLSLFNPSQQDAKVNIKDLKFPETLPLEFERCSRVYKLNSWIDHWGSSIDSGHYTATVPFGDNAWVQCDDDKLNGPNPRMNGAVKDNNVYLLFYEAV